MNKEEATAITVTWCIVLAYVSGFNFDSRGGEASFIYLITTILSMLVYGYPGWKK